MLTVIFNRYVPSPYEKGRQCKGFDYDPYPIESLVMRLENYVESYSDAIESVMISGDELDHILKSFNNIPMNVKKGTSVYRGELARFIMENW